MLSSATTSLAPPLSPPRHRHRHRHRLILPSFDRPPLRPSPAVPSLLASRNSALLLPIAVLIATRRKCFVKTNASEDQLSDFRTCAAEGDSADEDEGDADVPNGSTPRRSVPSSSELLSLGIPAPVYEVVEVNSDGLVSTRKIHRRSLLKSSGLRPRDIRSVDPSLRLTNSMPSLLVRENAILLNMGSLRAIVMQEQVLIFNYNRKGGQAFIEALLPRLNLNNTAGGPCMPFVLEVVEAALVSRIQRLEQRMTDLEPRVQGLLEILPNRLTADALERLRTSKQSLVELGSKAGALKEMLLDLLEDTMEIRRICVIGRQRKTNRQENSTESSLRLDKETTEKEEEIEMLLENYLQRCESCHGQAERLLDSAKEMEDSISVNLSSRRLEVSKVDMLLQVGAFLVGIGALVAGIFGMNMKSHLEKRSFLFWMTTTGIFVGVVVGFFLMYLYLRRRKIL